MALASLVKCVVVLSSGGHDDLGALWRAATRYGRFRRWPAAGREAWSAWHLVVRPQRCISFLPYWLRPRNSLLDSCLTSVGTLSIG